MGWLEGFGLIEQKHSGICSISDYLCWGPAPAAILYWPRGANIVTLAPHLPPSSLPPSPYLPPSLQIVIPFFSLLIKDIYFLNEGCATRLANGHINFEVGAAPWWPFWAASQLPQALI